MHVVMERRVALLLNDRYVVDLDGKSPVIFSAPKKEYYVVVKHRTPDYIDNLLLSLVIFT